MPAITVPDFTVLPRLTVPGPSAVPRRVVHVHTAPSGVEGEGFPVRRAFAGVDLVDLDPFVHMDQMGAVDYGPGEPKGTPWHPHRGFETVTYILDGAFVHQDSAGGGGRISDGDTQWMTAGSGLLHIEAPPEALVMSGGLFHGVQLWVNLPAAQKWHQPRYQDLRATDQTLVTSHDGGALVRLIAGELDGHSGPGATLTPITMAHVTLAPGAVLSTGWDQQSNCLVYALAGRGRVGSEGAVLRTGQLALLGPGDCLTVTGDDPGGADVDLLLLGGQPIREPVAWAGPFVMNTRAEVLQAFDDYRSGRLGSIPEAPLI